MPHHLQKQQARGAELIFSEFKRAVRQFGDAERVYVSVPLPPFQGFHLKLMEKKMAKSQKGSVVGSTPWCIDQATYLMKLENPVQRFLGLEAKVTSFSSLTVQRDDRRPTIPFDLYCFLHAL